MPFAPSLGDIIALSILIKDLIKALEESRGSSAEYQDCVRKLWALNRVVREVEAICKSDKTTIKLNAHHETLLCIANQCKGSIENFVKDIRKFGRSLRKGGSGSRMRDTLRKVQWQILRSDELAKITAEVGHYCSVFSLHISTASIRLLERNEETLHARLESVNEEVLISMEEQRCLLKDIKDQLHENNRLVRAGNTITAKIMESLRLEWVQNLSLEFKKVMQSIFVTPLLTYQMFRDSRGRLPSHLERCLYQEPFVLEDSHGRVKPIYMDCINSWDAFHAWLDVQFRGLHGHKSVRDKGYVLHEAATNRDIELGRPWELAFLPGQKIVMCMIIVDYTDSICCPQCFLDSPVPYDAEIKCTECGIWYRRKLEPREIQKPRAKSYSKSNDPSRPVPFPISVTSKKRRLDFSPDADAASFKRVRIVSRHTREPGRSREQRLQEFNDAVVYLKHLRNDRFEQRPEVHSRFLEIIRSVYQQEGFITTHIHEQIQELLEASPRIRATSDGGSSAFNSNTLSSPDNSFSESPICQEPRSKKRKTIIARPVPRDILRANSKRVTKKPASTTTAGETSLSADHHESTRLSLALPNEVGRIDV